MRIIFMGTPQFGVPTLERLVASEHELLAVYTQPDRAVGRGRVSGTAPVKKFALAHGLAVRQPPNFRDTAEVAHVVGLAPDLIVVAAFGQILPENVLCVPSFGCLNVHPSLLPRYRGPSPIASAILAGDEETGVSIMLMDAGMDTGPVLACRTVRIAPHDTAGSLGARLAGVGADLLLEVLPQWIGGLVVPQTQKAEDATRTRVISKGNGEIDWGLSAVELGRQVRAFSPWPCCHTRWRGRFLKVLEAIALPGESPVEPGTVVALTRDPTAPVGVGTGAGILGLVGVQLEGKRAMSAAEFVRGQEGFVGASLARRLER